MDWNVLFLKSKAVFLLWSGSTTIRFSVRSTGHEITETNAGAGLGISWSELYN
jgi:hypothetical protein